MLRFNVNTGNRKAGSVFIWSFTEEKFDITMDF
jgi:hypothetical protein